MLNNLNELGSATSSINVIKLLNENLIMQSDYITSFVLWLGHLFFEQYISFDYLKQVMEPPEQF